MFSWFVLSKPKSTKEHEWKTHEQTLRQIYGVMDQVKAPQIDCEQLHTVAVADLAAAVDFYTAKLGFTLAFKWGEPATMAGLNLGRVQIFLEKGQPDPKGCSVYFVVSDADLLYKFQKENAVEIIAPPEDKEWRLREYTIRDLDGYYLLFGHRLKD